MRDKMIVYIAGAITGVANCKEHFARAKDRLEGKGFTVLNPSDLPAGMSKADYMRICFAEIDTADAVYFLEGYLNSKGANLELHYCSYTGKRAFTSCDRLVEYFSRGGRWGEIVR